MNKQEYKQLRESQLGAQYHRHSTSKTEWDKCIAMECGDLPVPDKNRNGFTAILLLLCCKFTAGEIDSTLQVLFPDLKNQGRAERMAQIFTAGKCKNVSVLRSGTILGLKWDRYKFFDESGKFHP